MVERGEGLEVVGFVMPVVEERLGFPKRSIFGGNKRACFLMGLVKVEVL
jgi:hypothetical protein